MIKKNDRTATRLLHDGAELKGPFDGGFEQGNEKKKVILWYDLLLHRYAL